VVGHVCSSVLRYAKVTRAVVLLTAEDEDVARGAFGDIQQVHNHAVLFKVCCMHDISLACKRKYSISRYPDIPDGLA
jgi:hypothetical protein